MRTAVSIYGDKEYITGVSRVYVFFTFPDGSQDRLKPNKVDLKELYEWVTSEMEFYHRMYEELYESYTKRKEIFDKSRHFYSKEEIDAACRKDRFANIGMETSNENWKADWNNIMGVSDECWKINDKYWKYYKLAAQIKAAYESL